MTVAIAPEITVADAIRTTRLRQLRRVARDAPEGRLDMGTWTTTSSCGTTRCLAGWAVFDPWMRENTPILDLFHVSGPNAFPVGRGRIYGQLANTFGISVTDSLRLFGDSVWPECHTNVTRHMVLRNIDRLLAGLPALSYGRMIDEGPGGEADGGSIIGDDDDDIDEAEPTGVDEFLDPGDDDDDDDFDVDDDEEDDNDDDAA